MTREDMCRELEAHCDRHWAKYSLCHGCPLWTAVSLREGCYDDTLTDEQVQRNYNIVFGEEAQSNDAK